MPRGDEEWADGYPTVDTGDEEVVLNEDGEVAGVVAEDGSVTWFSGMEPPRVPAVVKDEDTADADEAAQEFFRTKRAAAVLKHAILSAYVVPFASKTGSASVGNRVVLVDGYAGQGRYEDGTPGSPELIVGAASQLKGRTVECYFVEKHGPTYKKLAALLDALSVDDITLVPKKGTAQQHMSDLLAAAAGVPLLVFLDPYGLGPAFDEIVQVFDGRPHGQYTPGTELLLRFDANAIRRIRGVSHSSKDYKAKEGQIKALDRAAGGTWWRDKDDRSLDNAQYLEWFIDQYLENICKACKCAGWSTDVKNREHQQPAYYLVFLTRHRDGMEVFGQVLSKSLEKWRRFVFEEVGERLRNQGQASLVDSEELFLEQERELAEQFQARLMSNLPSLLQTEERFHVADKLEEVFAGVLGLARETHLRKALKALYDAGETTSDSKGNLYKKTVVRATPTT